MKTDVQCALMNLAQEQQLAQKWRTGCTSLSLTQKELAAVQHQCRQLRGADQSCEALRNGISGACAECLLRAGVVQNH